MPKGNIFYKNSAFSLIKKFFDGKVINKQRHRNPFIKTIS